MENEHVVPKIELKAMINIPVLNLRLPRRIALTITGVFVFLMFLLGQGLSPVLFGWIMGTFLAVILPYALLAFEELTLDRWSAVLWEYLHLPAYIVWQPGPATGDGAPSRRGGARPDDLFGR